MDRNSIAATIREHVERRLAATLNAETDDLAKMRLGTMVHLLFLLAGTDETIGGFNTTMRGIVDLVGHELVWKVQDDGHQPDVAVEPVVN